MRIRSVFVSRTGTDRDVKIFVHSARAQASESQFWGHLFECFGNNIFDRLSLRQGLLLFSTSMSQTKRLLIVGVWNKTGIGMFAHNSSAVLKGHAIIRGMRRRSDILMFE